MKRKFLILILCFTIIFTSINFKRSYADGGVISLPLLATVSALAVGSNIVLSGNDDIYDLGYMFHDYVSKHNSLTWSSVLATFNASVSLQPNKLVSVKSDFLDIVKGFFDDFTSKGDGSSVTQISGMFVGNPVSIPSKFFSQSKPLVLSTLAGKVLKSGSWLEFDKIELLRWGSEASYVVFYLVDQVVHQTSTLGYKALDYTLRTGSNGGYKLYFTSTSTKTLTTPEFIFDYQGVSIPYTGGYTWDNIDRKREEDNSLALPVPGDLGALVGQGSDKFWDNTDNLVGNNDISIPTTSNPSISLDNTTSFPNTNIDTDNPSIPDTDNPSTDIPNNGLEIFPSWGGGIDFSPITQSSFTDKFPFSLASDIKNILNIFDVDPIAPKFEVPIVSETIELDLTEFEQLASIIRFFVLVGFIISLILITRGVIG